MSPLLLALGLLARDARANPENPAQPPLDEEAFAALVQATRTLLDQEDLDGFATASRELEASLGGLTFAPEPRLWAEYLVNVAVVAHYHGEDWRSPLATALTLEPGLDRGVGPQHEMAAWTPPPPAPPTAERVPRGAELYIDGQPAGLLPAPDGLHLVQLHTREGWRSALLRDAPVPADWLPAAEPPPSWSLAVSAFGGPGRFSQTVDDPGDFVGPQQDARPGLGAQAQLWWGRPLAVQAELSSSGGLAGHAAAGVRTGPVFAGLGALARLASYETLEGRERAALLSPALALHGWTGLGASLRGDVGLLASGLPGSGASATLSAATTMGRGATRFRAGLSGTWRQTTLVQEGSDRSLSASLWQVGATAGLAWGAW
jgi:hypothetical protein